MRRGWRAVIVAVVMLALAAGTYTIISYVTRKTSTSTEASSQHGTTTQSTSKTREQVNQPENTYHQLTSQSSKYVSVAEQMLVSQGESVTVDGYKIQPATIAQYMVGNAQRAVIPVPLSPRSTETTVSASSAVTSVESEQQGIAFQVFQLLLSNYAQKNGLQVSQSFVASHQALFGTITMNGKTLTLKSDPSVLLDAATLHQLEDEFAVYGYISAKHLDEDMDTQPHVFIVPAEKQWLQRQLPDNSIVIQNVPGMTSQNVWEFFPSS